ncbi:hypothetical protein [Streptomyces sp. 351MFTsu5.1]|uniref:hypothetical protein n=1 Tax=Streptomyces sp. 351MFTsu5.1 TaxID=1172180 RepID=UPI00036F1B79|nr:hypothetical protein [Streptomyces sp. 351MFTsu5.1]
MRRSNPDGIDTTPHFFPGLVGALDRGATPALVFAHPVTRALGGLAEDAVLFAVLLSVIAYVRSRSR